MATLQENLDFVANSKVFSHYKVGLEKESLRITPNMKLSSAPHPSFLGSPLFNPYFTLDFANAQIEWTTPAENSFAATLNFLEQAQRWTQTSNHKEAVPYFWPYSMPMKLKDCPPLADFGSSHEAKRKYLYRKGLCNRYGTDVQTICGIHYNLSFHPDLFSLLYIKHQPKQTLKEFITSKYFHICRNYLRSGWLITYLFGASPFSLKQIQGAKDTKGLYLFKNATSLRMSQFGYYSRIQEQMGISYNSLQAYLRDMNYYTNKSRSSYTAKLFDKNGTKKMLNDFYLQIFNEHYSRIRPKSLNVKKEDGKISIDHIDYVEVRSLDINPLNPIGIDQKTCEFLHLFLLTCLLQPSHNLTKEQNDTLTAKQNLVALSGRETNQILCHKNHLTIAEEAHKICSDMALVAEKLDQKQKKKTYTKVLQWAREAIDNPALTNSGLIIKALEKEKNFGSFTKNLLQKQSTFYKTSKVSETLDKKFTEICEASKIKQIQQESKERILVPGCENLELSTQVLIKKAREYNLNVSIIDPHTNLIEISQGKIKRLVKQATITELDSYMTYSLMKDKKLSKIFLERNGLETPQGFTVRELEEGLESYNKLKKFPCVIKPVHTNYGIGINFIKKDDKNAAKKAIQDCLKLDTDVIIEKWIKGKEYRFLVIDGKLNSVIFREPANVIGDGQHTIKELVDLKNQDPYYHRAPYYLDISSEEIAFLKRSHLTPTSIPPKGKKIYLRENSNVSTGGDPIEVTSKVSKYFGKVAVKAAASCNAKICGVDIIIPSLKGKSYSILEINYNPAIFFHDTPYQGEGKDPASAVLKLLGF